MGGVLGSGGGCDCGSVVGLALSFLVAVVVTVVAVVK